MLQFDLMTSATEDNSGGLIQLQDAELIFWPQLLQEQETVVFKQLMRLCQWQTETIRIAGVERLVPRLTAWYGEPEATYRYSGIEHKPKPWFDLLLELKQRVEQQSGHKFNSALCNLYRNGQDSVAWHADDEAELGTNPVIASLSFGASRQFQLKHRTEAKLRHKISLTSGSLLLMKGATQKYWLHQIPKEKGVSEPRINITFRQVYRNN